MEKTENTEWLTKMLGRSPSLKEEKAAAKLVETLRQKNAAGDMTPPDLDELDEWPLL